MHFICHKSKWVQPFCSSDTRLYDKKKQNEKNDAQEGEMK